MNHYSQVVASSGVSVSRRVSSLLFGNRHRLELLAALAESEDGRVNLSLLADEQGVPPSVYYGPIKDLMIAGVVTKLPQISRERRRWYERSGDGFWDSVRQLLGHLPNTVADLP